MRTRNLTCLLLTFVIATITAAILSTAFADQEASNNQEAKPKVKIKVLQTDKLDGLCNGKKTTATIIEVTFDPLAGSPPHRHPGPVCGYVVEGILEFQIGDQPLQTLKEGDTFFEPAMILHRVGRNPDQEKPTRIVVTMIHPSDAKMLVIPEPVQDIKQ